VKSTTSGVSAQSLDPGAAPLAIGRIHALGTVAGRLGQDALTQRQHDGDSEVGRAVIDQ